MQIWKFLLFGVTGDLSKKKILPALSQFAKLNEEKVQIDLIGYSRSVPNSDEVQKILDQNSPDKKHNLHNIEFIQGSYENPNIFYDLIGDLRDGERLITYLAVPPNVFIKFLQNSCPFSDREIDILIEKPFGRDSSEYQAILDVVNACTLGHRVHFLDHYLFKTTSSIGKSEISNFKEFKNKPLKNISIRALEQVDVKERGGYYNDTGALKDMFSHLFSLLNLSLNTFYDFDLGLFDSYDVKTVKLGQYQDYLNDLEITKSDTNTYFKIDAELVFNNKPIGLVFESGKKLADKLSQIDFEFEDGSKLIWKLAPSGNLIFESVDKNLDLNLSKNDKMDHTNLFERILNHDQSRFVDTDEIKKGWEVFEKINKFIGNNNIKVDLY